MIHDVMQKSNSIIVYYIFFEQYAKEDTSLNEHCRDEGLEVRDFELDMIIQYLPNPNV